MSGRRPFSPVSASVKKYMTAVSARFAMRFPLSIQYQWSRYFTAAKASGGLSFPLRIWTPSARSGQRR